MSKADNAIEIVDKHDIVGKVVNGFEKPKVQISIWAVNGSQKIRFKLLERSMLITKALLLVMILKSTLRHPLLIINPS